LDIRDMEPSWLDLSAQPAWLWLGIYVALSATIATVLSAVTAGSLAQLARRSPSHVADILARTVPRPLGFALFLAETSAGLRWLPLPKTLEALTRHLLPFAFEILAIAVLMRVVRKGLDAFGRSNPTLRSSAGLGRGATWVVGLSLIALLISDALGVSLAPVLTALGIGSLAVALALQDTLSNFFSGISLVTDKPFRPGDFIRIEGGGQEGYVAAIGWRSTHLRTLGEGVVVVPNATLAKSVVTNFGSSNPHLAMRLRVDVALESDVGRAEAAFEAEAAGFVSIPGVRSEPAPSVYFVPGPGPGSMAFTVLLYLDPSANSDRVEHECRRRLLSRMGAEHIEQPRWRPGEGFDDQNRPTRA
jgi:small-conductance mechanosensitive channel